MTIYQDEKDQIRKTQLQDIVENAKKKVIIPDQTIPLGDLIEVEDVEQNVEEKSESESEKEDDESVELDMDELVSEGRLTNLTRETLNMRNMVMDTKKGFKAIPEEKEEQNEIGYFCDSQLRKHPKWDPGCGIGYFEFYQRRVKKARKQENEIFEEYQDQQKILMDIYFKEKEKMKKGVEVESDLPLVSHLINILGLIFRQSPKKIKEQMEIEEDHWNSEEEERIRPRRRRRRELSRDIMGYERARPVIEPIRQPVIRRVMTRSRARARARDNIPEINRIEESQEESDDGIEIVRRRMRTRNRYRLEELEQENEAVQAESSIGAKAGERRRRNNQRNMTLNGVNEDDNEDISRKESIHLGFDDDKANETPGRIITSFEDDPSKRVKYCFECSEEIPTRKKKRKCSDCERLFHSNECVDKGMMALNGDLLCLICYFNRKKEDKQFDKPQSIKRFNLSQMTRRFYGMNKKYFLDESNSILGFELTEGDELMLIPKMLKSFLKHYASILPTAWNTRNLDLLMKMTEDIKVSILDISFHVPQMKSKFEAENFLNESDLPLFQVLKLKIIDSNVNELRTKYNLRPILGTGKLFPKNKLKIVH